MPGTRIVLSVGVAQSRKIWLTFYYGGVVVFMLVLMVFKVIEVAPFKERTVVSAGTGTPAEVENIPGPAAALFDLSGMLCCGLPLVLLAMFLISSLWLPGAWLDGTTVTRRGRLLLPRSMDLATAGASLSPAAPPVLTLTGQNGQTMKLPLHGRGYLPGTLPWRRVAGPMLPAPQLEAFADALETNAPAVAAQLRTLASAPR